MERYWGATIERLATLCDTSVCSCRSVFRKCVCVCVRVRVMLLSFHRMNDAQVSNCARICIHALRHNMTHHLILFIDITSFMA